MLYLILGNIFALIASVCVVISVVKKNKKNLIGWQTIQVIFCIFSGIVLFAYAAVVTNCIALIRNILAYKNKLTPQMTFALSVVCIIIGWYINNLGLIGWIAIIASTSYTIFMYTTKNAQQMRYAMLSNIVLWLVHDLYIQSYPSIMTGIGLFVWTIIQIVRHEHRKRKMKIKLYHYAPKGNTILKDGLLSISKGVGNLKAYAERAHSSKRKDILNWLESTFSGRSRSISGLTEPIHWQNNDPVLKQIVDQSDLFSFDLKELIKDDLVESVWLKSKSKAHGKNEKFVQISFDEIDFSPLPWEKVNASKGLIFGVIRHYLIVLKDGKIPPKYLHKES